jgi:hypothetical protein
MLSEGVKEGLLEPADDQGAVVGSDKIYNRVLVLSDAGRTLFGVVESPPRKQLFD